MHDGRQAFVGLLCDTLRMYVRGSTGSSALEVVCPLEDGMDLGNLQKPVCLCKVGENQTLS